MDAISSTWKTGLSCFVAFIAVSVASTGLGSVWWSIITILALVLAAFAWFFRIGVWNEKRDEEWSEEQGCVVPDPKSKYLGQRVSDRHFNRVRHYLIFGEDVRENRIYLVERHSIAKLIVMLRLHAVAAVLMVVLAVCLALVDKVRLNPADWLLPLMPLVFMFVIVLAAYVRSWPWLYGYILVTNVGVLLIESPPPLFKATRWGSSNITRFYHANILEVKKAGSGNESQSALRYGSLTIGSAVQNGGDANQIIHYVPNPKQFVDLLSPFAGRPTHSPVDDYNGDDAKPGAVFRDADVESGPSENTMPLTRIESDYRGDTS